MLVLIAMLTILITKTASSTCPLLCEECDINKKCTKCTSYAMMYKLGQNKACIACEFPCKTCENRLSNCTSCLYDLVLTQNKCLPCKLPNCSKCLNSASCDQCYQGFNLTIDNFCVKCDNNQQCESSSCQLNYCNQCLRTSNNSCIRCMRGYDLSYGYCYIISQQKCEIFSLTEQDQCFKCRQGYFLEDKYCQYCPPSCKTCTKIFVQQ